MKIHSPARPAAFVIKWSHSASLPAVRELAQRVVGLGIPTTWAVEQASQIESLAGWGLPRRKMDVALLADATGIDASRAVEDHLARELSRRLGLLREGGWQVNVLLATTALKTGAWPRLLRGLGVRGLIVSSEGPAAPHALPFGVWHFAPHAVLPRPRRWLSWLRPRPTLIAANVIGPAVIALDVARMPMPGAHAWRQAEQALDEAAAAEREGTIALATVGDIAARLSEASAPRPQHSILRAA